MEKTAFFEEIADIFELEEEVSESTPIGIDSLAMLSIIALFDENFNLQVTGKNLSNVNTVEDLMKIAGKDRFQ